MTKDGNGNKVDWRSLHEELKEQSKERQAMEERLVDAFAQGCQSIHADMLIYHTSNDARVKCVEADVVNLRVEANWWKAINGTIAAAITGLGLWLGGRT